MDGEKHCIAWTCLIRYEHRERISFRQKHRGTSREYTM